MNPEVRAAFLTSMRSYHESSIKTIDQELAMLNGCPVNSLPRIPVKDAIANVLQSFLGLPVSKEILIRNVRRILPESSYNHISQCLSANPKLFKNVSRGYWKLTDNFPTLKTDETNPAQSPSVPDQPERLYSGYVETDKGDRGDG